MLARTQSISRFAVAASRPWSSPGKRSGGRQTAGNFKCLRRSAETPLRPHHDHPQTPQRQQRAGNFSKPQSGAAKSSPLDKAMIFSTIVRLTVLEISLMDDLLWKRFA
jgi:hypothetical protein